MAITVSAAEASVLAQHDQHRVDGRLLTRARRVVAAVELRQHHRGQEIARRPRHKGAVRSGAAW